jgi:hypothetical protein
MTFLVFDAGPNHRAVGQLKGTIEVQEVLGEHTSMAWITSLYDASGQEILIGDRKLRTISRTAEIPIQEGDLIFNMALGTHVAISGAVSWTGPFSNSPIEQMRNLHQFMRLLERQGVTVDAYVDLTDGQIRGNVTPRTNFLIRGEIPMAPVKVEKEKAEDAGSKVDRAVNESDRKLVQAAVRRGLFIISAENFQLVMGYRTPHSADRPEISTFRPGLPIAGSSDISEALRGEEAPKKKSP